MTSIHLRPAERQDLLDHFRRDADPEVRLRAHIPLLLDVGHSWATITAVLFCPPGTIGRWKRRFDAEGVDAVFGRPRGRKRSGVHIWAVLVVRWVLTLSPKHFRFARSRWSCEAAAVRGPPARPAQGLRRPAPDSREEGQGGPHRLARKLLDPLHDSGRFVA
jgi:hypothetical protein